MPFVNTTPEAKEYERKYSENTMKYYAWVIGRKFIGNICMNCGNMKKIHVHHKNKNRWDNRIENLDVLCAKCHFKADFPTGRNPHFLGKHHSDETKEKLRRFHLGGVLSEEHKAKIRAHASKYWLGKTKSPEMRKKLSETRKRMFKEGKLKPISYYRKESVYRMNKNKYEGGRMPNGIFGEWV